MLSQSRISHQAIGRATKFANSTGRLNCQTTLFDVLLDRGLMPVQAGEPERVANCFVHGYRRLPAQLMRL